MFSGWDSYRTWEVWGRLDGLYENSYNIKRSKCTTVPQTHPSINTCCNIPKVFTADRPHMKTSRLNHQEETFVRKNSPKIAYNENWEKPAAQKDLSGDGLICISVLHKTKFSFPELLNKSCCICAISLTECAPHGFTQTYYVPHLLCWNHSGCGWKG